MLDSEQQQASQQLKGRIHNVQHGGLSALPRLPCLCTQACLVLTSLKDHLNWETTLQAIAYNVPSIVNAVDVFV